MPKKAQRSVQSEQPAALVCAADDFDFDRIDSTSMFNTLGEVRALPAEEVKSAIICDSVAEAHGYSIRELYSIAEIGYHYLRCGGHKLAEVIFEGLVAIKPNEHYFLMALALVKDHLGQKSEARSLYQKACKADPKDPRPDLNLAELDIEAGQRRRAVQRIDLAKKKAVKTNLVALADKADALLILVRS